MPGSGDMDIEGNRSSSGAFHAGEPLSSRKLNNIGITADYGITKHSDGVQSIQGPFGTVYMDNIPFVGDGFEYDYPFKVTIQADEEPNTYRVYVRAGMANNFVPTMKATSTGDKVMDSTPVPFFLMSSAPNGVKYVVLKCLKNPGSFYANNPEVRLHDDPESFQDSDLEGHLLLASIAVEKDGGVIKSITRVYQYIYTSQVAMRMKAGESVPVFWSFTSR